MNVKLKNNVLVLGANSFAGAEMSNFLLNNNFQVTGISRSKRKKKFQDPIRSNKNQNNFKFYQLDINKNKKQIRDLLKENKYDFIIDYLGQGMVAPSWTNPVHWIKTNISSKIEI